MSLRKVDISRLMDAYEDTEFLPKEELLVNTEHIKEEVMGTVKGKRRISRKMVLVAAALVACLALAGWGYGGKIFDFLSGGQGVVSSSLATRTSRKALNPNGFKAFCFFQKSDEITRNQKSAQKSAQL